MPKKVGFLAVLGANYGSALQSFALYNTIKGLGYDCEVIGASAGLRDVMRFELTRSFMKAGRALGLKRAGGTSKEYDKRLTQKTFSKFIRENFKFNKLLWKIPDNAYLFPFQYPALLKFDAFVCGSDQIWKPAGFWFCAKRYLQFVPEDKRVGYAPSVGWNKIPSKGVGNIRQWKTWLSSVKYLSARETSGSALISKLTGRPVPTVLDPTLLLTPREWDAFLPSGRGQLSDEVKKQIETGKPYLLAYLLDTYAKYKPYVESLASALGLQIIWLTGRNNIGPVQRNSSTTDPAGFLQLIRNASFMCVDGFHGTAFSINYGKPFALFGGGIGGGANDSRKRDLMRRLGIKGRIVKPGDDPKKLLASKIDYAAVAEKLDIERRKSKAYLSEALKGASESKRVSAAFLLSSLNHETADLTKLIAEKVHRRVYVSIRPRKSGDRVPLANSDDCTGCGACANTCPVNAITMKPNENGFLHPVVDDARCVHCGKCIDNCPLRKRPKLPVRAKLTKAYAAWAKDPKVVYKSASGGMSALLSDWTFAKGGVVYGVAWDEDLKARTVCAANKEELLPICGSKYVQADTGLIYRDVKKRLEAGVQAMFTGTSCQVAGLYAYLGQDYGNLLTVDLLCGGVPSPMVLKSYLNWRERTLGSKIVKLEFRSKKVNGWSLGMVLGCENGKVYRFRMQDDEYGILYNKHYIQRPSCFACRFRGIKGRWADITIGDFWGIGKHGVPFNHERRQGVSVVFPNSEKGKAVFKELTSDTEKVFVEERPLKEVFPGNGLMIGNCRKRPDYGKLYQLLREKPFEEAFNEYFEGEDIRLALKLKEYKEP